MGGRRQSSFQNWASGLALFSPTPAGFKELPKRRDFLRILLPPPPQCQKVPFPRKVFPVLLQDLFSLPGGRKRVTFACSYLNERRFHSVRILPIHFPPIFPGRFNTCQKGPIFLSSPFVFYRCKCKFKTEKKSETSKAKREKDRSTFFWGGEKRTYQLSKAL